MRGGGRHRAIERGSKRKGKGNPRREQRDLAFNPAPHQSDAKLRLLVYRTSRAPL
jgi:hypothetical protein